MHFLNLFTLFHVLLSLVGIVAGAIFLAGLCSHVFRRQTAIIFLAATSATTVTGFLFPFKGITPGIILGLVSIPVLLTATLALHKPWAKTLAVSSTVAEYLNVLVLIAQLFQKLPFLRSLSPPVAGPVMFIVQLLNLLVFSATAFLAARQRVRQ